ncbi:type VI secretion system protein TssL, long form [Methylobacterium nodulans]|uniref:Type IV / VI secretion system protein, DotU family n=1 Tax=Methylobacterium nodulans (strain LMG 21967 / CNCM I-2342 / ORS 2060) TaxID=460265 RepID=B8IIB9_METNO|nr:type VI secretion system protein TssL, long form [Methylobacterium nodulans]ACL57988.1 type IV / VI secretion system protein, DotU family [Methylobacterium nodulans ORS 2060]
MNAPFDPFGRSDRTIILPNPAGRRAPQAALQATSPAPEAPVARRVPASLQAPFPAPSFAAPPAMGEDAWARPDPLPPAREPAPPGRALVLRRDVVVAPNENPFLRAAGPLLLLIGRLRVQLSRASFANLMEQVAAAIEEFEREVRGAGASPEQTRTAKYVVCATADDVVQNIPTEDRHVWTQYSMLSRFFGERVGGVRFFEELERAKLDPAGNYALLELQHACLALGFQGIHRTSAGGAAALQAIQRNLYETLRRARPAPAEISPRWQGQDIPAAAARPAVPLWTVAAVTAAALLALYLALRLLLARDADTTAETLVTLHPTTELGIQRRAPVPPPPPPPPPPPSGPAAALRDALAADASAGRVTVEETNSQVVVRLAAALFAPGDAAVTAEFRPLLQRVAGLIAREPGPIRIVGHTDSAPVRNGRFASNFDLSVARAKAVAAAIRAAPEKPERLEVEGKGPDAPVAPNDTVEGRARNRRVEILIPRGS